jgi:hypothetical protein
MPDQAVTKLDNPSRTRYRSLSEAAGLVPPFRSGRPVRVSTLTRWITDGVRGRDGVPIRLKAKRLPGRWVVADEAVAEFIEALTDDQTAPAMEASAR